MPKAIDADRLLQRLTALGETGRDAGGRLCRVAATDADRAGRDLFCDWASAAGLQVEIDRIGNIFAIWTPEGASGDPLLIGSHIDTVIDAGIYDGCYGVLSGLAVIEALQAAGATPARPIAVAAFTNEEGVRFAPDMMGSLVAAGGLAVDEALAVVEAAAQARQLSCRRMTSGAGHDAQMMARVAPSAMIFVPSRAGISHNPQEFTAPEALVAGANVLLDVAWSLCG